MDAAILVSWLNLGTRGEGGQATNHVIHKKVGLEKFIWITAPYNQIEHEVVFSSEKYVHLLYVQVIFVHLVVRLESENEAGGESFQIKEMISSHRCTNVLVQERKWK